MTTDTPTMNTATATENTKSKSFARHLPTIARILLGLMMFASGMTALLNIMPPPPPNLPAAAVAFNTGMAATGYMFPMVMLTQLVVGVLLLSNRFVPLALALLAPFVVNSVAFHFFLVQQGLGIALFMAAMEVYLAWSYREAYRPMLAAHVTP